MNPTTTDHAQASGLTCEQVVDLVLQYVDRQLDEPLRSRVRTHIEMCPPCSEVVSRQGDLSEYFRDVLGQIHEMPDDVRDRLVAVVRQAQPEAPRHEALAPAHVLYPPVPPDPPGMTRPDLVHLGDPVEMGGLKARFFVPLAVLALGLIVWFAIAGQADAIAVDARRYAVAPEIVYRVANESPEAYSRLLAQLVAETGMEPAIPIVPGMKFLGACTSATLDGRMAIACVFETGRDARPIVVYTVWDATLAIAGTVERSHAGVMYRVIRIDGDTLVVWSEPVRKFTCIVVIPAEHEGDPLARAHEIRTATMHSLPDATPES